MTLPLGPFLQQGLRIAQFCRHVRELRCPGPFNEAAGRGKPSILVNSRYDGLAGITERGLSLAPASRDLTARQDQETLEAEMAHGCRTGAFPDEPVQPGGQVALTVCLASLDKPFGNHQVEHPVPKELKALV